MDKTPFFWNSDLNSADFSQQRKRVESPPRVTSIPSAGTYDRSIFLPQSSSSSSSSSSVHQHSSSTLPHQSTSHPQVSPHYSTSSLPHKHTSLSLSQQSSPSIPRSTRSRTSCIPPTPAPTAPLPVCPSPQTGIRYVSPSCQEPHAHLQAQSIRYEHFIMIIIISWQSSYKSKKRALTHSFISSYK